MTGPLLPHFSPAGLQSIPPGIPTARLSASRKHDRKVAAKALREAAGVWASDGPFDVTRWLNARADAIEAGEVQP